MSKIKQGFSALNTPQPRPDERLAVSISDTAWLLGNVSKGHVRNMIDRGVLARVKIGRRTLVTMESIKSLLKRERLPKDGTTT